MYNALSMNKIKKMVLVIEDDESLRTFLKTKLEMEGIDVSIAENGKVGLNSAMSLHPDYIVLDMLMPVEDGLTMLKELRADSWGKFANVIVLSASDDIVKVSESLGQGVTEYIHKNTVSIDEMVEKIKNKVLI